MDNRLFVLLVEDSEDDALLVEMELVRGGYEVVSRRVQTADEMIHALDNPPVRDGRAVGAWDLVLADYSLPAFDGLAALQILRENDEDTPFIIVSGAIGEETAVQIMKTGANDYVMKDNLARLHTAVERELKDSKLRRENRITQLALEKSETLFKTFFMSNPDAMSVTDLESGELDNVNEGFAQLSGYDRKDLIGKKSVDLGIWHDLAAREQMMEILKDKGKVENFELTFRRRDGSLGIGLMSANITMLRGRQTLLAIVKDITIIREAEEEIRTQERNFRTIFDTNPDCVSISRLADDVYIAVNEGFVRGTGYSRDETIDQTSDQLGLFASSEEKSDLLRALKKEGTSINNEIQYRLKDGSIRTRLTSASILEIDAEPCVLNISKDITVLKEIQEQLTRSLQEKEILLLEIHHRVKNNMQVVMSLLKLQSNQSDDEALKKILEEIELRIASMSLVHDQLYKAADLSNVDFGSYINKLVDNIMQSYLGSSKNVTIDIDIDEILLSLDASIPCGLIASELVTNALKHAFPDGREGQITISMSNPEEELMVLTVQDNGIGIPANADTSGSDSLGLMLVDLLSKNQLSGTLEREDSGGTTYTISFRDGEKNP